ncbi:MAG: glycosyltransferase family 4 protein, partial [Verrucomicrobiae bacterium]|nr:glycosyltransferase family 4 protein [Verrucomicrobiae bacterium]
LGARGYRIVSIWHVDVVEYFTKFYLRGWVRPEAAARWSRWRWLPDILKLVFHKQADCVRASRRIVVPSAPMREMIVRCYPDCAPEKIMVMPWGNIAPYEAAPAAVAPYPDGEFVIMTLSRLSPEKGIERLLYALRHLGAFRYRLLICGAPAYMKGRRYERKLRRLAKGLPVEFLGHVTGAQKAALLRRADLFVSPSRHESYGLTIAEAEAAGCRIISHGHYGASGTVVDCDDPVALAAAIRAAAQASRPQPVTTEAALGIRIKDLLLAVGGAS